MSRGRIDSRQILLLGARGRTNHLSNPQILHLADAEALLFGVQSRQPIGTTCADPRYECAKEGCDVRKPTVTTSHRDPDHLSIAGRIVEIYLIIGLAVLFNVYPQRVGFIVSANDPASFTPMLAPGFEAFLPWLNTYWFWAFNLCLASLVLRRWTSLTRLFDLLLDLFGAAIVGLMIADTPFLELPVAAIAGKTGLVVVCFALLLGASQQLFRLVEAALRADEAQPSETTTAA